MAIIGKLVAVALFLMLLFVILWGEILVMEHIITIGLASGLISTAILYSVVFICFISFLFVCYCHFNHQSVRAMTVPANKANRKKSI